MEQTALESLRVAGTATLATQLFNRGFRSVVLRGVEPMSGGRSFAGPARTLRYVPAREDVSVSARLRDESYPQRALVEDLNPGDVLVVDARGELDTGVFGEIVLARAAIRGAAGVVTDGALRDAGGIAAMELPIYAGGRSPGIHLQLHEAADADVVIACGGVQVRPGDVLVGDEDGVVCVPRELVDEVAGAGAEQTRLEEFVLGKVRGGAALPGTYPPGEALLEEYRRSRS